MREITKGEKSEAFETVEHRYFLQHWLSRAIAQLFILSYIYIGIYWNNHHHLLQAVRHINGRILWANLHLLFWLSLVPFATGWMGENNFAATPVALYGTVLFFAALAYFILSRVLVAHHGLDSALATAIGKDFKGKVSLLFYAIAILLSYVNSWFASSLYFLVAIMWFIPDRRIERNLIP